MRKLQPYNPEAKCPKCGGEVKTSHAAKGNGRTWSKCPECSERDGGREHLDRYCARCHYVWPEAVIPRVKPVVDKPDFSQVLMSLFFIWRAVMIEQGHGAPT